MKNNCFETLSQKINELNEQLLIDNSVSIENTISSLYNSIYEDYFFNILIKSKKSFLYSLSYSIKEIISSLYESKNIINIISKIRTNINKRYDKDFEIVSKSFKEIKNKKGKYNYLNNFVKHCAKTDDIAYHTCINNQFNKYYEIRENNEVKYIFCPECKYCFLPHCIKMVCLFCNKEYFSRIIKDNEEKNIFLANWNKYHCGSMKNHIMKCINCKNNLYINLSTNILICKNKECNFSSDPYSILWKCSKCGKDFRSNAKVYNQTELEIIKKAIYMTLLNKKRGYPKELPCCKKNTENIIFYHNDKCKGILYSGFLFDKKILVCNICNALNFEDKFIWNCPLCKTKFHLQNIISIKPFKPKKYVIIREHSYIDKKKSKMEINNLKQLKIKEDNINNNISINNYFEKINYYYNNQTENEIDYEYSFSRDRKKKRYKKIESISIDNSSNQNKKKEKSEDKTEKKYKTLIDILNKRKINSEKNKMPNNFEIMNDFSFNHNNSINYFDGFNIEEKTKEKKLCNNKMKKIKNFFETENIFDKKKLFIYQKKLYKYQNSRQNKINKFNKCISEIKITKNKPYREKDNINIISIENQNDSYKNKSCQNIKYNTIYQNKIINQKQYIIRNINYRNNTNKDNFNNIYEKKQIVKDYNYNIINNNIKKDSEKSRISSTKIYKNKIIKKENLKLNIKEEISKKLNKRKSLNLERINKININNIIINNNSSTLEKVSKISKNCIIPDNPYEYKYIKLIKENAFNTIYLVENQKNKKQYFLKKIFCENLEEIILIKSKYELLYSINHPNIIKIYNIHFKYLDYKTYSIYILMEKAIGNLFIEIKEKIKSKKYYDESEIINILKQIINVFLYLKEKKIVHNDIKPQDILIFPGNIYKIDDSIVNEKNNKKPLKINEINISSNIYGKNKLIKYNSMLDENKRDVYNIGYILLYAISLNLNTLENIRKLNSMDKIINILDKYFNRKIYSDRLYYLILGMIEIDENKRYSLENIINLIKEY